MATALGVEACHQGVKAIFINCHELIQKLQSAYEKGTLERFLKRYANYELLIIDEIGYLPIAKQEAISSLPTDPVEARGAFHHPDD